MNSITQEELKEINDLRTKLATVVSETGQYTLQLELLQADIEDTQKKIKEQSTLFKTLLNEEQTLVNRLSEKYGVGSINFETGEFTPEQ